MRKHVTFLFFIALLSIVYLSVDAVEIEYVGTLENNLFAPSSITVDNNSLTVLEPFSKEIKIFTPEGLYRQKLHIQGDANSICKLSEDEYLYCDLEAHIVAYVDMSQDEQSDYFENTFSFLYPIDIILDSKISILDSEAKQIVIFNRNKEIESIIQLKNNEGTFISFPNSFVYNTTNNNYYVFDQLNSEIWIIKPDGTFIKSFSAFGAGIGEITRGGEISVGNNGLVYISDRYQNRVSIFSADGEYLDMIPNGNINISFNTPTGITIDENNILYVASTENSKIQMFHITSSNTSEEAVTMEQLRPLPYDTVQTSAINFFATASTQLTTKIIFFDFEIYSSDNTENLIASSYSIAPTKTFDTLQNITIYTAQWITTEQLETHSDYQWRTRVHSADSAYKWSEFQTFSTSGLPLSFSLAQNYPNPFNPTTTIDFTLANKSNVSLEIFNLNGQKVITLMDKSLPAGKHSILWSGKNIYGQQSATGIYFYRLTADEFIETKKMVLLK